MINSEQALSVYVPFGGEDIGMEEEAIVPAPEYPLLQYATGLPAQRPKLDEDGQPLIDEDTGEQMFDNVFYAGFFTECGKDKPLDEAMGLKKVPYIFINHSNGETVKHWCVQKPTVFIMAKGVPSNGASKGEYGMVLTWRSPKNGGPARSVLYVQLVIRQLLPDYTKPFVLTCKSTQTDDAIKAMKRQYKVITRAHEELRRVNKDMPLPLWAYSLTLGPSTKQERREKSATDGKMIFPMLSSVPDVIEPKYLQRHEMPIEYVDLFKEATAKAVEWSKSKMQAIEAGTEPHEPWMQQSEPKTSNTEIA